MGSPTRAKAKIFISHKHKHQTATQTIKVIEEQFLMYATGKLDFLVAEEMPVGVDWRRWIKDSIHNADVMFFLQTGMEEDWDWCLYEAGIFEGLGDVTKRLILFHRPEMHPPSPINHLQAVKVDEDNIKSFLKQFFGNSDITGIVPPPNQVFAEDDTGLTQLSRKIRDAFINNNLKE